MDETTLVTFIIDCEPGTRCVDLYGSWDNFHKPYSLSKDKQMGHGRWHGCHRFRNIICDGDPSQHTAPRQGALKTGGLYWFYFKINDDLERPNMAMPTTTKCLLLPGQMVNVLEIPMLSHDELPETSGAPALKASLDPDGRKTTFGRGSTTTRRPDDSWKALDSRRLEYLEQSLVRLKTAAGHTHMLTCLGHASPQRLGAEHYRRLMTSPMTCQEPTSNTWLPGGPTRAEHTAENRKQVETQSSSASGTLASAREHATVQRSFSNPFKSSRQRQATSSVTSEAKVGHHHILSTVEESRTVSVPVSANPARSSASSQRQETLDVHPADVDTTAIFPSKEYYRDANAMSNLQLRLACARLEVARAEASSQTAFESARQRLISPQPTEATMSAQDLKGPDRRGLTQVGRTYTNHTQPELVHTQSETPNRAVSRRVSAFSTPFSTSPLSPTASASTWGSPLRRSTHDDAHTPVTDYDWHSRSRASQLYSNANSREGLGLLFEDLSLASQETIKQDQLDNGTASNLQSSSALPIMKSQFESVSQRAEEIGSPAYNGPPAVIGELTSELTYLGSAIV